LSGVQRPREF